uniref:Uncharacterized protein n=1 Tax=Plectus sambesii TaxID=2011161 RepID=A0A914VYB7_9BILA
MGRPSRILDSRRLAIKARVGMPIQEPEGCDKVHIELRRTSARIHDSSLSSSSSRRLATISGAPVRLGEGRGIRCRLTAIVPAQRRPCGRFPAACDNGVVELLGKSR